MRHAIRLTALGLALGIALGAHAQPAVPPLTGRVMDHAGVLTPSTEQVLGASLAAHEDATGNQVVVLTVPSLEGETVEAFALRVFNTWGLGQAEHDNGVLVLIARDDRTMRIEVGYGLEGALTDARAGRIIRNTFIPSFRNQDYDTGTHAGVNAILGTLDGTYEPPADDDDDAPWAIRIIFGLTHVLLPGLFGFFTLFYDTGWLRYGMVVFLLVFIGSGGMIVLSPSYGWLLALVLLLLYILADVHMGRSEKWSRVRRQVTAASRNGKKTKVTVGGVSFFVGGAASGGGGRFGSSGGFSSGGGFSGGGGSSGGGGASGSW